MKASEECKTLAVKKVYNIILLDKAFLEDIEEGFLYQKELRERDFILVSTVDISVLNQHKIAWDNYQQVLCSSKHQKITKYNWKKHFLLRVKEKAPQLRVFKTISELNQYNLGKWS